MKQLIRTSVILTAFLPVIALAAPAAGEKEFTLSGAGSSSKDFDNTAFSIDGSYAQYLDPSSAVGVRQSISISDSEDDDTDFSGSTRLFYDYHFGMENLRPFVGVNLGGIYGDGVDDTFSGGPELGVKYYVGPKTFVMGMMEYQFLFKSADEVDDRFDDGAFFYSVGLGYNF
jgi:hypothetical protein